MKSVMYITNTEKKTKTEHMHTHMELKGFI